jgi:hypothetical protein
MFVLWLRCITIRINVTFYWLNFTLESLSKYKFIFYFVGSRDSSVGIATCYGLEGPRIESRWVEIFRTYPDRLRGPPSLLYNG